MAHPILTSVKDVRTLFAHHGHIKELLAEFDTSTTVEKKAKALRTLAQAVSSTIITADVGILLQFADDIEGVLQPA